MIRRACDRITDGESRENVMNYEWLRLETYKSFPESVQVWALRLARAGFYYTGQSDVVKCFSCAIKCRGWKRGDVPWEIHKRVSPSCEFIRGTDCSDVAIRGSNSCPLENGISEESEPAQNLEDQPTDSVINNMRYTLKFPKFADLVIRLSSFLTFWIKEDIVSTSLLGEAGFFYAGVGDSVRCFYCGLGLRNWEHGDDPWVEHAKHFPWCTYLFEQKGRDFIREHSNPSDRESLAFLDDASSASVSGDSTSNKGSKGEISHENGQAKPEKSKNQRKDHPIGRCDVDDSEEDEDMQNQKKECNELKDRLMCKICLSVEKNVVFLPCSHMVSCQTCAPHVSKCPLCRKPIEGRKKIFLS